MWDRLKTYVNDVLPAYQERLSQRVSSWRSGDELVLEEIDIGSKHVRILNKIAEGGYSCVYLAEEVVGEGTSCGGTRYALKRIACGGREQLKEARKEIDVMEALEHPNILVLKGHAVVGAKAGSGPATEIVYMLFDVYVRGCLCIFTYLFISFFFFFFFFFSFFFFFFFFFFLLLLFTILPTMCIM